MKDFNVNVQLLKHFSFHILLLNKGFGESAAKLQMQSFCDWEELPRRAEGAVYK